MLLYEDMRYEDMKEVFLEKLEREQKYYGDHWNGFYEIDCVSVYIMYVQ